MATMNLVMIRSALLWCAVIDYGLLLVWFALYVLPHAWLYRLWARWFRLSAEQFDALNFAGMMLFKMSILLLAVVPYIALLLVA